MFDAFAGADGATTALLVVGLLVAFGFEFVNGFHDTANAVATVIYARSMRPGAAVAWSGFWNALGVIHASTTGLVVAFSIVHLLPVDLLVTSGETQMSYAQGTSAQLVTAGTILAADVAGAPVSTTHILSSAIAGSMAAGGSGLQASALRNIALAWVLTLPASLFLGATLFLISRTFVR